MAQEIPFPSDNRDGSGFEEAENVKIPADWLAEFDAAAQRPLKTRFRYAFIKTYKPVMDDQPFRAFATFPLESPGWPKLIQPLCGATCPLSEWENRLRVMVLSRMARTSGHPPLAPSSFHGSRYW